MRKFTIFTFILTIIIVVVGAEMLVNDYLPKLKTSVTDLELTLPESLSISDTGSTDVMGNGLTNQLGSDIDYSGIINDEYEVEEVSLGEDESIEDTDYLPVDEDIDIFGSSSVSYSDIADFEDENFVDYSVNVYLREDQVRSAGFANAYLEQESTDGYLYKTIYIDDLYDVEVSKTVVRSNESLFVKVYVFTVGPNSAVDEVYQVLKIRAAEGLDVEVNETDEYGDGSFYMNDVRRGSVVFLTIRMGELIYGFSYPKEYHSQVMNLIALIDMEF